jgi:hypothetical protein
MQLRTTRKAGEMPPVPSRGGYLADTFASMLACLTELGCEELAEELAKLGMSAETIRFAANEWEAFTFDPPEHRSWFDAFAQRLEDDD